MLTNVFPDVARKGCYFHWTQPIRRKTQELGMAIDYMNIIAVSVSKFIHHLMFLTFLPAEHITPMFTSIIAMDMPITPMPTLFCELLNYIQTTWIYSNTWSPTAWSIFNRTIHTINDCEGWHHQLNSKLCCHNLLFYQLIAVMCTEATMILQILHYKIISHIYMHITFKYHHGVKCLENLG